MAPPSQAAAYDLVVIGGGSAGLTAAGFAARIGATVLIAAERLGGDCTWTGCIPSKTLIRAARRAHDGRLAGRIGIGSGEVEVDFPRVMADVRAVIERVYAYETSEALAKQGVEVALGPVRFLDAETVETGGRRIGGRRFVICTGAEPYLPPIPGLAGVPHVTYETLFDLDRLPPSLIVVGSGATGVEMAQAFARLGSQVTLVEECDSVLPAADPDATAVIRRQLEAEGIAVHTSTAVKGVAVAGARIKAQTESIRLDADALLLAVGRRPRVAGLDLDRAGVELDRGAVRVDRHLRTTASRVYAAGDVTGGAQFTHYAGWQGFVAARNALLPGAQVGVRPNIPWAVFTDPEVAQAGIVEAEARLRHGEVKVHRMELDRVDRAQTEDQRGLLEAHLQAGRQARRCHGRFEGGRRNDQRAGARHRPRPDRIRPGSHDPRLPDVRLRDPATGGTSRFRGGRLGCPRPSPQGAAPAGLKPDGLALGPVAHASV